MPHLRELGHEPVAWLMPRRSGRPAAAALGGVTDRMAPRGSASSSRTTSGRSRHCSRARARPRALLGFPGSCRRRRSTWLASARSTTTRPAPTHRGPIPMAWALREGDGEFGVTWHRMDAELDTGPILAQTTVPIEDDDDDDRGDRPGADPGRRSGSCHAGLRAPRGRRSRRSAADRGRHVGRHFEEDDAP